MPSSPKYVRDYARELETSIARGERPKRAARNRARRIMANKGMVRPGDGKDVDHITPLSKGGAPTAISNLRVRDDNANRSYPRNPDGSMKRGKKK